ncbi:MAG: hypothetical protein V3T77_03350, partial [Planctomycetota bacterium]
VILKLAPGNRARVIHTAREVMAHKVQTQPLSLSSAGCVYRNPEGQSAGHLIEAAGLKGARIGSAVVSTRHANFIVYEGDATAEQMLKLMALIESQVADRFHVVLEREIVSPPEFPRNGLARPGSARTDP